MPPVAIAIGAAVVGAAVAVSAMRAKMKAPKTEDIDRGFELSRKLDPNYPREVAVGKFATGGSGVYDTVSGAENKYVWRVTAISDYEITAIDEIWIDGQKVTLSGDPLAGWVSVTDHLTKESGDPTIRFRIMKGTEDQALDSELAAAAGAGSYGGQLTASDTFAGMAIAIMRWEFSPDDNITSEPSQIVFAGEGAPVHDPNDETSDPDDPSTWSRTSEARFNPALIAAQAIRGWKRGGEVIVGAHGIVSADIPEASLAAAADICDELVETDTGTEKRYRCGGMIRMDPDDGIRPSLERVIAAMDGDLVEIGGTFTILAGAERVAEHSYDLQAIGGRVIDFDEHGAATQRYNETGCSVVDPDAAWEMQDLPAYAPAAHLAADDGRTRVQSLGLDFVFSRFQGTRIQKAKHERSRLFATATFDLPLIAEQTEPMDWFTVTDEQTGLTASVWEAQTVQRINTQDRGSRVIIQAQGIAVEPWSWDQDDADAVSNPTPPTYPGGEVPDPAVPVLTVSAATVSGGGATMPAILAEFSLAESPLETHVEFEYWPTGDTGELRHARCLKSAGERILAEGVAPATEYQVRARLIGGPRLGQWCDPEAVTTGADFIVTSAGSLGDRTAEQVIAALDARELEAEQNAQNLIAEAIDRHAKVMRRRDEITAAREEAFASYSLERSERIAADEAEITTRETQIAAVNSAISLVEQETITNANALSTFASQTNTQLSAFDDSLALVESNITTVSDDLTALTSTVNTQFSAVDDSIAAVQSQVTTNASAISAEVTNRQNAVATVSGNLASLQSDYDLTASEVDSLGTSFTSLSATVTSQGNTLSAVSSDLTTVQASVDSLEATRIQQVATGATYAGVLFSAVESGGDAASDIRFAAGKLGFGTDYADPDMVFDMVSRSRYVWNAARTHKTIEEDWSDGRLRLRKADGTLVFDSATGLLPDGLPAESSTQVGNTGSDTNVTVSGWTVIAQSSITGMLASGVVKGSGYFAITTSSPVSGNSWRLRLSASGETTTTIAEGQYQTVDITGLGEEAEGIVNFSAEGETPFGGNTTLSLEVFGSGAASGRVTMTRSP